MPGSTATRRLLAYKLIALLIGIVGGLALSEIGMRYYVRYVGSQELIDPGFLVFDSRLGWRMQRNWSGRHRHHDFDVRYTTNDRGLRGPWPEAGDSSNAANRYVFVGDSFTFGLGVDDNDTFVHLLNRDGAGAVFLNAGMAGYSTDQEYLFLKEQLPSWHAGKVYLVVYLVNDLLDNTLRYPLQAVMAKPLFTLESGELKLANVPVPLQPKPLDEQRRTLGTMVLGEDLAREQDRSWRNQWQLARLLGLSENATDRAVAEIPQHLVYPADLFVRLAQAINQVCDENRASLTIILMPGRSYVEQPHSLSARFQEILREEILKRQGEVGVTVIDLASQLRKERSKETQRLFHPNEGHLTTTGHQVVAGLLRNQLRN